MAQRADQVGAAALAQVLGGVLEPGEWLTDRVECEALSADVYSAGVTVDAIVRPTDRTRLAKAIGALTAAGYAIVARGGGLSYTGGYLAERSGTVVVDTAALTQILSISAEDMLITVEAGVTWKRIYEALHPLGLRLPFFGTFSGAGATVGGGLSNGALFFGTARYGTAADCMLAMEVVLADGTMLRTGQAGFRNVSKPFYRTYGPDLAGLFIHESGVFGVKTLATFRLIRTPAYSGFASFAFPDMESAGRALSEVARTGAAEEAYVFDPETTKKNLAGPHDVVSDAKTLGKVIMGESNLLKGLKAGAQLVVAGRHFIPEEAFSLHMVCAGRSEAALDADLEACRKACRDAGGHELPNSIPKAVRASLFPELDGVLGPDGDRWAALNAKVAHSDATRIMHAATAALQPYRERMKQHGIWMSHLLIAIGSTAFSFEPVFHWMDEWLPPHERFPSPATLARLKRPAANPQARALVEEMRKVLVQVFADLGAASNQIGKTYPYLDSLEPAGRRLVEALKAAVDPQGRMNPGGLGLR